MNNIPRFKIGDSVRIMHTVSLLDKELANQYGFIQDLRQETDSIKELAQIKLLSGRIAVVPTDGLMRNVRTPDSLSVSGTN